LSQQPPIWRKNNQVFQVGITGGIGSGKSTISKAFVALGVPYYDADAETKAIMNRHIPLRKAIQDAFGNSSYNENGLNRPYLADKVFHSESETQKLNAIVHPFVAEGYAQWIEKHKYAPYILKEAALLFESGSYQSVHFTINISVPPLERLKRVLSRDSFRNQAQIKAIMERQWSEDQRLEVANFTLPNSNTDIVLPTILELHSQFQIPTFQEKYGIHRPSTHRYSNDG
jgi:dephospho-CoA kinase